VAEQKGKRQRAAAEIGHVRSWIISELEDEKLSWCPR